MTAVATFVDDLPANVSETLSRAADTLELAGEIRESLAALAAPECRWRPNC